MNSKSLMWLGAATLVIAGVAALSLKNREAAVTASAANQKLFPDLLQNVNDVASITIKKKDGECTLQKSGEQWVEVEKKGYPVDIEPVRKTLIGLTEATLVEEKTSDKSRYAKLGVQDPDAASTDASPTPPAATPAPTPGENENAAASPTLVTLKNASGKVLASVIVGKAHEGKSFGTNQVYVRRAGEERSWLAKASFDLKDKPVDWLDKKILEVKRDRVKSVDVKHPDGETVHVERAKPEDTNFVLSGIPDGKELTFPTAANGMGSSLEWLNMEDVVPASDVDFKSGAGPVCRFTTFDGLTITVTTKDDKEKTYARFEASYEAPPPETAKAVEPEKKDDATPDKKDDKKPEKKTPEEVQKEVASLNARLSPWVFVIPSYNKATFTKKMSDLTKDKAPPAPPPGATPVTPEKSSDGAAKANDPDTYKIPDDLPPEIQKQIQEHQASLGHKTEIVPAKPKSPPSDNKDAKSSDAKPSDSKPADSKPPEKTDDGKTSDTTGQGDKPKDDSKPPHR